MTVLFWKKVAAAFLWAFLPVFAGGVLPVWDAIVAGDWETSSALFLALISGSVTAGLRAAQALFSHWESPIE